MNQAILGTSYVASFKYSPIMWNIGQAIGESIRFAGYPVRYLQVDDYQWMINGNRVDVDLVPQSGVFGRFGELFSLRWSSANEVLAKRFREDLPSTLVFVNSNPLVDRRVIGLARRVNPNVRVVSFVHEPYTAEKMVYGPERALLLTLYEVLNEKTIKQSDGVILPSPNAMRAFELRYPRFRGDRHLIPLPVIDQVCLEPLERRYVTFVGHTRHAYQKGIDLFFEMVEESSSRCLGFQFQIVSSSKNLQEMITRLSARARGNLKVTSEKPLYDRDISRALRESIVVILLQRRVMQSGVIPVSFMNGTPVIVSRLDGFTQFVEHGRTGWVLPVEPSLTERFSAIENIRQNLDVMSRSCRRYYEETFDSCQVRKHVSWILGETPC
jgi:glycosyltransferase involved in cell wall biosynthesis